MPSEEKLYFKEVQQFREPWLWLGLILFTIAMVGVLGGLILYVGFDRLWTDSPVITVMLFLGIMLGLVVPLYFYLIRMTTEIRGDHLCIRFFPVRRRIPLVDVDSYEIRTYSPVSEYQGWGIRGTRHNRAYSVSGNRGMQLEFKNGDRILIGSNKPEDFIEALESAMGAS